MAKQECITSFEVIKINASQLRGGRRVMVCVFNDNIDLNLSKHVQSSSHQNLENGDFWISFGSFNHE
jgi:hypothetical protein